jgi:hypothetical protein
MLRCLLMKELTILAFGDDLHHTILSCSLVEFVPEGFVYDSVMTNVICIHHYEYSEAIECLLLWRYTSSSSHLRLTDVVSHQSGDTF